MFFFLLPFRGDWRHFCFVVLSSIDCLRLTNWNGILLHSRIWAANHSSTMAFNLNFFDVFSNFVLVHETVCRFNLTREKVYIIRNGTQRTHTHTHLDIYAWEQTDVPAAKQQATVSIAYNQTPKIIYICFPLWLTSFPTITISALLHLRFLRLIFSSSLSSSFLFSFFHISYCHCGRDLSCFLYKFHSCCANIVYLFVAFYFVNFVKTLTTFSLFDSIIIFMGCLLDPFWYSYGVFWFSVSFLQLVLFSPFDISSLNLH